MGGLVRAGVCVGGVALTGGNLGSWEVCVGPGQPLNDGVLLVTCMGGKS